MNRVSGLPDIVSGMPGLPGIVRRVRGLSGYQYTQVLWAWCQDFQVL
jgi:hypothetical protein